MKFLRMFSLVLLFAALCGNYAQAAPRPVCDGNVCALPENLARPVRLAAVREDSVGAVLPQLDYIDSARAIFHSHFGLFVYDLQRRALLRALDLRPIDAVYMQGSVYTRVRASEDGRTVYIDNAGYETDGKLYAYDVEANFLAETTPQGIPASRSSAPPPGSTPYAGGEYRGQSPDGRLVYFACPGWRAKNLQLVLCDAQALRCEIHEPLRA